VKTHCIVAAAGAVTLLRGRDGAEPYSSPLYWPHDGLPWLLVFLCVPAAIAEAWAMRRVGGWAIGVHLTFMVPVFVVCDVATSKWPGTEPSYPPTAYWSSVGTWCTCMVTQAVATVLIARTLEHRRSLMPR
jgi:hypothetical protein